MSNFNSGSSDRSGRSQKETRETQLVSELSKGLDQQHHNTSLMHEFGSAFEAPQTVAPGTSSGTGSVGVAPSPARSDHQHGVEVPTFVYPTGLNGWTNYGGGWMGTRYYKMGGRVYVEAMVSGGTIGAAIWVMGVGYRPLANIMAICPSVSPTTPGRVDFLPDGTVLSAAGWGNNAWMYISINFLPGA